MRKAQGFMFVALLGAALSSAGLAEAAHARARWGRVPEGRAAGPTGMGPWVQGPWDSEWSGVLARDHAWRGPGGPYPDIDEWYPWGYVAPFTRVGRHCVANDVNVSPGGDFVRYQRVRPYYYCGD